MTYQHDSKDFNICNYKQLTLCGALDAPEIGVEVVYFGQFVADRILNEVQEGNFFLGRLGVA